MTSTAHRPQLDSPSVTHVERMPARPGFSSEWPGWASAAVVAACRARGISAPWAHQAAAASLAFDGTHVVLATGTGSGKSLVATAAHMAAMADGRVSFYSAPIKALVSETFFALCEVFGAQDVGVGSDARPALRSGGGQRVE